MFDHENRFGCLDPIGLFFDFRIAQQLIDSIVELERQVARCRGGRRVRYAYARSAKGSSWKSDVRGSRTARGATKTVRL